MITLTLNTALIFYWIISFPDVMHTVLTYPKTLMFVSNTETTTLLSNETSLITSRTAFSNSSTSPRTLKEETTHNRTMNKKSKSEKKTNHLRNGKWSYWLTANVSNVSINVKENLTKNKITKLLTHWNTVYFLYFQFSLLLKITGWGESPGDSCSPPPQCRHLWQRHQDVQIYKSSCTC